MSRVQSYNFQLGNVKRAHLSTHSALAKACPATCAGRSHPAAPLQPAQHPQPVQHLLQLQQRVPLSVRHGNVTFAPHSTRWKRCAAATVNSSHPQSRRQRCTNARLLRLLQLLSLALRLVLQPLHPLLPNLFRMLPLLVPHPSPRASHPPVCRVVPWSQVTLPRPLNWRTFSSSTPRSRTNSATPISCRVIGPSTDHLAVIERARQEEEQA